MDELRKFDRYCYEMQQVVRQEEVLHSPKMAMIRKKLRKMLLSIIEKSEEDISVRIENFWKVAYYLPINRFLKNAEKSEESETMITMFCGEFQELEMLSNAKYSSLFNLYLGDLYRYIEKFEESQVYYAKSIEIDNTNGRAFNMLAMVKSENEIIEKLRLFLTALLVEQPYKQALKNLEDLISKIELSQEATNEQKNVADFIFWVLFDVSSNKIDHNKSGTGLLKTIENITDSDILEIFILTFRASKDSHNFVHVLNVMIDVFIGFQNPSVEILCSICQFIHTASEVFGDLDNHKKVFDTLPIFTKNKWEKLCDSTCKLLNCKEMGIVSEQNQEELENINLIHSLKFEKSIDCLSFWAKQICETTSPHFEFKNDEFQRISQTNHRKLDIPKQLEKIKICGFHENEKPIYLLFDLQSISENLAICLKIWQFNEFICAISSKTFAELDKLKTSIPLVRRALRELAKRQKIGKIQIINAKNDRECCEKLIGSAKKNEKFEHKELVGILVEDEEKYLKNNKFGERFEGVSIHQISTFYTKCTIDR